MISKLIAEPNSAMGFEVIGDFKLVQAAACSMNSKIAS